uniref:Uncharacterized protein n=1 Tax=Dictyoglomus thermophilum TaxID=14 RepID=A0A7C3RLF4_DICTH
MKSLKIILLSIFILTLISVFSFSQNEADASIVISQETLNKFLSAIGEIKRTESFNVSGIKSEYTWIVKNPRIILDDNKARFEADVSVSIKFPSVSYTTPAYGEVSVKYLLNENRIYIKVEKVAFEVAFSILGKKVKVGEVDITKIYQIAFSFPGPKPFESMVSVSMPDGSIKMIKIETIPVLMIEKGKIVVGSQINYLPVK